MPEPAKAKDPAKGILGSLGDILGAVSESVNTHGHISITDVLSGNASGRLNIRAMESQLLQAKIEQAGKQAALKAQQQEMLANPDVAAQLKGIFGQGVNPQVLPFNTAIDALGERAQTDYKLKAENEYKDEDARVQHGYQMGEIGARGQEQRRTQADQARLSRETDAIGRQRDAADKLKEQQQAFTAYMAAGEDIKTARLLAQGGTAGLEIYQQKKTAEKEAKVLELDEKARTRAINALTAVTGNPQVSTAIVEAPGVAQHTAQGGQRVTDDRASYEALRTMIPNMTDPTLKAQATALVNDRDTIGFGSGIYTKQYEQFSKAAIPPLNRTKDESAIPTVVKNKIAEQSLTDQQALLRFEDVSGKLKSAGPESRSMWTQWVKTPYQKGKDKVFPGSMTEDVKASVALDRSVEEQIALQMRDISGATVPPEEVERLSRAYIAQANGWSELLIKLDDLAEMSVERIQLNEQYARGEITLEDAQARLQRIRDNITAATSPKGGGVKSKPKVSEADFLKMSPQKQQEYLDSGGQ